MSVNLVPVWILVALGVIALGGLVTVVGAFAWLAHRSGRHAPRGR